MRSSSGLSPPVMLKLLVPTERSQRPLPHRGSLSWCTSYPSPRASDCPHSGSASRSFVRTVSKLCPAVPSSSPYPPPLFLSSDPQALESPAGCVCAPSAHRKASRARFLSSHKKPTPCQPVECLTDFPTSPWCSFRSSSRFFALTTHPSSSLRGGCFVCHQRSPVIFTPERVSTMSVPPNTCPRKPPCVQTRPTDCTAPCDVLLSQGSQLGLRTAP